MAVKKGPRLNLTQLTPSRKPPRVGDIFRMHMPGFGWFFGRVVSTTAKVPMMEDITLIYVYGNFQINPVPVPELKKNELLLPPKLINTNLWTEGYAEFVENRQISKDELWTPHCFASLSGKEYYDEHNNKLSRHYGPVGTQGLGNYRFLDALISYVLGIPDPPGSDA